MVDAHESSLVKQRGDWAVIERAAVAHARDQLAREVQLVSALLDVTSAMIATVDPNGRVVRCNDTCIEMLGKQRDEIEGHLAWEMIGKTQGAVMPAIRQVWESGGTHYFESSLVQGSGRKRSISWSATAVVEGDEPSYIVVTGQDITLHKEAERKLKRAYEMEHRIATTLQESLLKPAPEIPGVRVGVSYKPAVAAERVGGDFYDVYRLGGHRVVAVVGDVSGKGVSAAGLTETVRSTLRALFHLDLSVAEALTKANKVLLEQVRLEQFATAAVVVLDTDTGDITYASAGHPHPIIRGRKARMLDFDTDPPLGAFTHEFREYRLNLGGCDSIIMFTDGLTEARNSSGFFIDHLLEETSKLPKDPEAIVEGLLKAAISFAGGRLSDDIAILALRREDPERPVSC